MTSTLNDLKNTQAEFELINSNMKSLRIEMGKMLSGNLQSLGICHENLAELKRELKNYNIKKLKWKK